MKIYNLVFTLYKNVVLQKKMDVDNNTSQADVCPVEDEIECALADSSPPVPPPMPPTDVGIRFQIYKLQEQVETLEQIISEPQIVAVTGVQNLKPETGNTWKDKLVTLLYEACIPYFWTIDIVPDEDNHIDPNLAYIYFLNNATKKKAVETLTHYLSLTYNNHVCIL